MASKADVKHPYYPQDIKLDGYVPNQKSHTELLVTFFGALAVCMVGLWVIMVFQRHLKGRFMLKLKISWFFLCGLIHMILEGYFSLNHATLKGEKTFLAEAWKEYGKADSRYITSDPFTVIMESITAGVDGPLAFLATYAFLANSPYRYIAQLLLSSFQLYGDVLYMVIEWKEGFIHGPVGHPLYFWFYFVFLNAFWIIVPLICILESWWELSKVQRNVDETAASIGGNNTKKHR